MLRPFGRQEEINGKFLETISLLFIGNSGKKGDSQALFKLHAFMSRSDVDPLGLLGPTEQEGSLIFSVMGATHLP